MAAKDGRFTQFKNNGRLKLRAIEQRLLDAERRRENRAVVYYPHIFLPEPFNIQPVLDLLRENAVECDVAGFGLLLEAIEKSGDEVIEMVTENQLLLQKIFTIVRESENINLKKVCVQIVQLLTMSKMEITHELVKHGIANVLKTVVSTGNMKQKISGLWSFGNLLVTNNFADSYYVASVFHSTPYCTDDTLAPSREEIGAILWLRWHEERFLVNNCPLKLIKPIMEVLLNKDSLNTANILAYLRRRPNAIDVGSYTLSHRESETLLGLLNSVDSNELFLSLTVAFILLRNKGSNHLAREQLAGVIGEKLRMIRETPFDIFHRITNFSSIGIADAGN